MDVPKKDEGARSCPACGLYNAAMSERCDCGHALSENSASSYPKSSSGDEIRFHVTMRFLEWLLVVALILVTGADRVPLAYKIGGFVAVGLIVFLAESRRARPSGR
jgi:hypothetical protein